MAFPFPNGELEYATWHHFRSGLEAIFCLAKWELRSPTHRHRLISVGCASLHPAHDEHGSEGLRSPLSTRAARFRGQGAGNGFQTTSPKNEPRACFGLVSEPVFRRERSVVLGEFHAVFGVVIDG